MDASMTCFSVQFSSFFKWRIDKTQLYITMYVTVLFVCHYKRNIRPTICQAVIRVT